jgi:hypothetical protein
MVAAAIRDTLQDGRMKCEPSSAARVDAIVVVLSAAVDGSAQIVREVERASNAGKAIIAFRID